MPNTLSTAAWLLVLCLADTAMTTAELAASGPGVAPPGNRCLSDLNCSLNGVCNTDTGVCACDRPWRGVNCAKLGMLPAKPAAGYGQVTGPMRVSSWGGNVLQGRGIDNGTWHLLVAEMVGERCGLHVWGNQSSVVHATATDPQGPYTRQGLAVAHQAHNPGTVFVDGHYYMFHIGSGCNNYPAKDCNETWNGTWPYHGLAMGKTTALSTASALTRGPRDLLAPFKCTGSVLHRSRTPAGPWTPVVLAAGANLRACNNPSPYVHPNGTLFVLCKWFFQTAPRPEGPYTDPIPVSVGGPNELNISRNWEDPFLWTDRRGNFHALSHTWTAELYPANSISGHAYSTDGHVWFSSPIEPYNATVAFSDSTSHYFATMERPKLVFGGHDGLTPLYISNGVSPVPAPCTACGHCSHCKQQWSPPGTGPDLDWTFTLVRPLDV